MGGGNKKSGRRRLVNMASEPELDEYTEPSDFDSEEHHHFDLSDGSWLFVRLLYRGALIVWFVIEQVYRPDESVPAIPIARIDCCHSRVHMHRFNKWGDDVLDSETIRTIPSEDGAHIVNDVYSEAYGELFSRWEQNLEWWRRS